MTIIFDYFWLFLFFFFIMFVKYKHKKQPVAYYNQGKLYLYFCTFANQMISCASLWKHGMTQV